MSRSHLPTPFQYAPCLTTTGCRWFTGDLTSAAVSFCFPAHPLIADTNARLRHLINSGHLSHAREVFDGMPHRDSVSYTLLISGYLRASDPSTALSLVSHLRTTPFLSPDPFLLSLALKACAFDASLSPGASIHAHSLKSGALRSSAFVAASLLDMYSKTGRIVPAIQVFGEMPPPQRNVVVWTSMMTALVSAARPMEAVACFARMRFSGVPCDSHAYTIALKACADAAMLAYGREIHARVVSLGLHASPYIANSVAAMYSHCGWPWCALAAVAHMPVLDVVAWTTVVSAYVQMGRHLEALHAFIACDGSVAANGYTYAAAITACSGLASAQCGKQLHACVLRRGLSGGISVANALISMYATTCCLRSVDSLFLKMTVKDIVSWTTVISAYSQAGDVENTFVIFSSMCRSGTRGNEFTLASLLSTCTGGAVLATGRALHSHALMVGLEREAMVSSAVINMYAKCGCIEEARHAFDETVPWDVISWTSMINGYADHGCSIDAIKLFSEMRAAGVVPDYVTFIGVLSACSHAGMVDLGYRYFDLMKNEYEIEPGKEHYGCMVDLLSRAGWLQEAEELITKMPESPDDVAWSALLRACQKHGDAERGQRVALKILECQPECAGTHITLSHIYAADGRWKEAAEARRVMRAKGARKEAGWSWVENGVGVSTFVAGDLSHERSDDLYDVLELLNYKARMMGLEVEEIHYLEVADAGDYG